MRALQCLRALIPRQPYPYYPSNHHTGHALLASLWLAAMLRLASLCRALLCRALLCQRTLRRATGADTLLQLLKNFSRAGNKKMAITVGVVGACA